MPLGADALFSKLLCHADGVRNTGFEYIIGIDEEYAVVRINLGIGLEGLVLAVEHLHPGVRHRAAGRDAVVAVGQNAGSTLTAADEGCARTVESRRRSPVHGGSRTRARCGPARRG